MGLKATPTIPTQSENFSVHTAKGKTMAKRFPTLLILCSSLNVSKEKWRPQNKDTAMLTSGKERQYNKEKAPSPKPPKEGGPPKKGFSDFRCS